MHKPPSSQRPKPAERRDRRAPVSAPKSSQKSGQKSGQKSAPKSDRPLPRGGATPRAKNSDWAESSAEPLRIAKAMARAGLCSRREAERWIEEGRVSVNGSVLKTPAIEVSGKDRVLVDGRPLPLAEPTRLWRYHKP